MVAISWISLTASDEIVAGTGLDYSEPSVEKSGDIGNALKLLVSNKSIPRLPLKDLFAAPAEKTVQDPRAVIADTADLKPGKVAAIQKISTTPRLIGVVLRRSETRAFFVDKDKTYSLKRGDTLAGRYRIISITSDKVNVREISTGLSRSIFIKDE